MPAPEGFPCQDCRGVRLHTVKVKKETVNGKLLRVTRVRTCSTCGKTTDIDARQQPGICCGNGACNDIRLTVLYTRHRGPGVTVRVKQCVRCKHQIRTQESVESYAHKRAG